MLGKLAKHSQLLVEKVGLFFLHVLFTRHLSAKRSRPILFVNNTSSTQTMLWIFLSIKEISYRIRQFFPLKHFKMALRVWCDECHIHFVTKFPEKTCILKNDVASLVAALFCPESRDSFPPSDVIVRHLGTRRRKTGFCGVLCHNFRALFQRLNFVRVLLFQICTRFAVKFVIARWNLITRSLLVFYSEAKLVDVESCGRIMYPVGQRKFWPRFGNGFDPS